MIDIRPWPSSAAPTPGCYQVSNEPYHDGPGLSSSGLKALQVSPAEYRYGEKKESQAVTIGTLVHAAVLEPEAYGERYEVTDQVRTKARKEDAEARGVELIRPEDNARAQAIARAVWEEPDAAAFLQAPGVNEVAMYWDHPAHGFLCKCKPDRCCHTIGALVDLKKTRDPRPWPFQRQVESLLYHWSAAWYLDGATAATGIPFTDFVWIAVQEAAPHQVCVYVADREMLQEARYEMTACLEDYAACVSTGTWPKKDGSCRVLSLSRRRYRRSEFLIN